MKAIHYWLLTMIGAGFALLMLSVSKEISVGIIFGSSLWTIFLFNTWEKEYQSKG